MIRFSLRSRARHRKNAAERRQQSQQPSTFSNASEHNPRASISLTAPSSYLVNYDALPRRHPNGHAINYAACLPSRYYIPSNTRRKPRNTDLRDASNALNLDFDTLSRRRSQEDLIPLKTRIAARIEQLRRLLAESEQLGDVEVLKDLVGIHETKVSRSKERAETLRIQTREAKIIAGITEPDDRPGFVRKVSGKPSLHFAGRTVSALKARTNAIRSTSRTQRASMEREHTTFRDHVSTSPNKTKPDTATLSRKSSARLKRLGSAGSVLIRRLSKVSMCEDTSSGSSNDHSATAVFDQETLKRVKADPLSAIAEYEAELAKLQETDAADVTKLQESQRQLDLKRILHSKIMEILDQFYGSSPGWEDDPISQEMFPETAELTEGGLEAERDLADARGIRERARAAREDHGRTLSGLNTIATEMGLFISDLEELLAAIAEKKATSQFNISNTLRALRQNLEKSVRSSRMAAECCPEAPRIVQLQKDLESACEGFVQEANAVLSHGGIYQSEFSPSLRVAKTISCDCKLAETFVAERQNMIAIDYAKFENMAERCEEYVLFERVGLLDLHHPTRSDW